MSKTSVKFRKTKIVLASFVALILLLAILFFAYVSSYSSAGQESLRIAGTPQFAVEETKQYIACVPTQSATIGYVFYPGGKVDERAYLPYLAAIAEQGYLCIVLKVPFHLAILDTAAADAAIESYSSVTSWVVGGHSLGGAVAAMYIAKTTKAVSGLILLAAYPNEDISALAIPVLSITATNDGVLNGAKFNETKTWLPTGTTYLSVVGGNHAQFGDYGVQKGDGTSNISAKEQRMLVVEASMTLLQKIPG